jgi:hypothetical protein
MNFDTESLKRQIPYYLTAADQRVLVEQLRRFSSDEQPEYFSSPRSDTFREVMLQGDGWPGFELYVFDTGKLLEVRGIVLSNSCDVSPDNTRDMPTRVTFAPLVKFDSYRAILDKSSLSKDVVSAKLASIKAQKTTNMIYLPASGPLDVAHVIRLDDLYSMPVGSFKQRDKLFTLSMFGFYMFVLKLSIHFCRLQENVNRYTEKN